MTDQPTPRSSRRTAAIVVVVLVAVIAAVALIGLLAAHGAPPAVPQASAPSSVGATSPVPTTTPSTSATPSPSMSATKSSKPAGEPTPQATKTASLSSSAPIVKELTATVTKVQAVQGQAQGPGEIAGPSLRFTITISNHTGRRVSLANTVVNVYSGKGQSPAIELSGPGAEDFPAAVANGSSATGLFVFNVPKSDRSRITVTVDTSVSNPVVAFRGSAS